LEFEGARRPGEITPMPTVQFEIRPLAAVPGVTDDQRWARLIDHARAVAAKVLRRPRSHPDVEDRAQDALLAFLSSGMPRFDASLGTPEALLGAIVRNGALSQLRDGATRARLRAQLANETLASTAGCQRQVEAVGDLGRVFSRLCPGHVEALVRIDLGGEGIADAARRLGKSYQAMNGQVGHARAAARRVALELVAA
jgi:DNA-directed RNA polymerase specialized sigma24 family protein